MNYTREYMFGEEQKKVTIQRYIKAVQACSMNNYSNEWVVETVEQERYMHRCFGMSYREIEEIEIAALKAMN